MKMFKTIIITCFILIVVLLSCSPTHQKEGQKQPLVSLSGKYIVEMPILKSNKNLNYAVWTPTIKDKYGKIVYSDKASNLSGYHNSYWDWGVILENGNDDFWVYNSDNGQVSHYYLSYGKWEKTIFDIYKGKLVPPAIIMKKIKKNSQITMQSKGQQGVAHHEK